ncbi:MAG: hypothetical protein KIT31_00820 [Deltaproteobacteria bacterium]|nr:hypothetical protein [Deltaproteobacteria bacterium]
MALCAAMFAGRALARVPHRELLLALLAFGLLDRGTQAVARRGGPIRVEQGRVEQGLVEGEVVVHPALVTSVLALGPRIPAGATAIVPERHIAFMVAWYTRAPIRIRPDDVPAASRVRILPLAWIEAGSPLDEALLDARAAPLPPPLGAHPRHPNGLVLVTEPVWDWALARVPPEARAYWGAWPTR